MPWGETGPMRRKISTAAPAARVPWSKATARAPPRTSRNSAGPGLLGVAADASRRAALANGATGLARFNGGAALLACHRCSAEAVAGLAARASGGLALVDYAALAMAPDLAAKFEHVVLVDAPRSPLDVERVTLPFGAAGPSLD